MAPLPLAPRMLFHLLALSPKRHTDKPIRSLLRTTLHPTKRSLPPSAKRSFLTMKAASSSSTTTQTQETSVDVKDRFVFVPFGKTASDISLTTDATPATTISCDGRIEGTTLELTHWNGNETPNELYADTSTEIALNFFKSRLDSIKKKQQENQQLEGDKENAGAEVPTFDQAWVLNNHFDTDGTLASWIACHAVHLEQPSKQDQKEENEYRDKVADMIHEHSKLLISAAAAGDFGEWTSDEGVKLDCALLALYHQVSQNDKDAYDKALPMVPALLNDLQQNHGKKHQHLWQPGFEQAQRDWDAIQKGLVKVEVCDEVGGGRIVLVKERNEEEGGPLSAYALHRALTNMGHDATTNHDGTKVPITRVLRVTPSQDNGDDTTWKYAYEKPGHGWVDRLVLRPSVPTADGTALAAAMNEDKSDGVWQAGGNGLTAICETIGFVEEGPEEVLGRLIEHDPNHLS